MDKTVIIDYGLGNLRSVEKKIKNIGLYPIITHEIDLISKADKLILPGVGHFKNGMINLKERNLIGILNQKVLENKVPILGICLGMQLFSDFSEEGNTIGLSWLDAKVMKFTLEDIRTKVPHMGWNNLKVKKVSRLMKDITDDSEFYFVHSYHVDCNNDSDILATTEYGYEFVSAVQKENIFGVQFHPEKSQGAGETLLRNFLSL